MICMLGGHGGIKNFPSVVIGFPPIYKQYVQRIKDGRSHRDTPPGRATRQMEQRGRPAWRREIIESKNGTGKSSIKQLREITVQSRTEGNASNAISASFVYRICIYKHCCQVESLDIIIMILLFCTRLILTEY